ncbi:Cai-1 autoinducer sensor kinase/phosphatase cqss [Plakobranchus ocellatus]|uniref:Cai-1 autoinducer sensor kinase/phosphatase cqss n=1 Tax=Plakobranchus ocellatus TaxID=259542 RepID=A0AAV4CK89_9GAST|nr:Cai-1 autoinducer sensor kinase/phosphatase cqss [Plakobranchus ocellatus]
MFYRHIRENRSMCASSLFCAHRDIPPILFCDLCTHQYRLVLCFVRKKRDLTKPSHATADYVLALTDQHFELFHPAVSHYHREHAPNRRYMSPEITIRDMHTLFKEVPPDIHKVDYDSYRRRLQKKKKRSSVNWV